MNLKEREINFFDGVIQGLTTIIYPLSAQNPPCVDYSLIWMKIHCCAKTTVLTKALRSVVDTPDNPILQETSLIILLLFFSARILIILLLLMLIRTWWMYSSLSTVEGSTSFSTQITSKSQQPIIDFPQLIKMFQFSPQQKQKDQSKKCIT